jgi:hypothetical protein
MVPVMALWMPILVAAVFVFVLSSVIHMVLPYHKSDFSGVPNEDHVREGLRAAALPPGDYVIPYATSMEQMKQPDFVAKYNEGPVAFMTVLPNQAPAMGKSLILWFLYSVLVGIFAAYVAGRALGPDAHYLSVFRFVGVTAFLGYGLAHIQASVWYSRSWSTTAKNLFDALLYAFMTAGAFGWLWPA